MKWISRYILHYHSCYKNKELFAFVRSQIFTKPIKLTILKVLKGNDELSSITFCMRLFTITILCPDRTTVIRSIHPHLAKFNDLPKSWRTLSNLIIKYSKKEWVYRYVGGDRAGLCVGFDSLTVTAPSERGGDRVWGHDRARCISHLTHYTVTTNGHWII